MREYFQIHDLVFTAAHTHRLLTEDPNRERIITKDEYTAYSTVALFVEL